MTSAKDPERTAQNAYDETGKFYSQVAGELGTEAHGFRILYGPPVFRPPLLFVGFQPGKGSAFRLEEAISQGEHTSWPTRCVYSVESWPLAKNLRRMFGEEIIARSTGLNAIFIRARTAADYARLPANLRRKINEFSMQHARDLIEAMEPERLVAVGLDTLRMFGPTTPDVRSEKGRVLTERGMIGSREAIATLHLSGAQISNPDRVLIADRVIGFRSKTFS